MDNKMNVLFDVQELYYLPQYLPVHHDLIKRGQGNTRFIFHRGKFDTIIENIIETENLNHVLVDDKSEAN